MTIIAWDGRMVAADRQATKAGMRLVHRKLVLSAEGLWTAATGTSWVMSAMLHWYDNGCDPAKFPDGQAGDDGGSFIVFGADGAIRVWERGPHPIEFHPDNRIAAWGAGRDYAIGAMEMGADAVKAVEIACRWETSCGHGVDSVVVRP